MSALLENPEIFYRAALFIQAGIVIPFAVILILLNRAVWKYSVYWDVLWASFGLNRLTHLLSGGAYTVMPGGLFSSILITLQGFAVAGLALVYYRKKLRHATVFLLSPLFTMLPVLLTGVLTESRLLVGIGIAMLGIYGAFLGVAIMFSEAASMALKIAVSLVILILAAQTLFVVIIPEGSALLPFRYIANTVFIAIAIFLFFSLRVKEEFVTRQKYQRMADEVLENVSDIVFRVSSSGEILYCSNSFRRFFGSRKRISIGQPGESSAANGRTAIEEMVRRVIDGEGVTNDSIRVHIPQTDDWYEFKVRKDLTDKDDVFDFLGRDIQPEIEREKQLVKERERASELDEARVTFLSNLSHELKTPLTIIMGYAETMREDLPPSRQQMIDAIMESAKYQLRLVNDLLDLTRLGSKMMEIEVEPVDVEQVITETVEQFRPLAERKHLSLVASTGEIPPSFHTDPVKLIRILNNVMSNALKFTEVGQVSLMVRRESEDTLLFRIEDTGSGISKQDLSRVFERFVRISKKGTTRGTGLGLSLAKELVALLGGRIWVESEENVGTVVYFTIKDLDQAA